MGTVTSTFSPPAPRANHNHTYTLGHHNGLVYNCIYMHIQPYADNAKKHPKKQVEQIAESIKRFGMNQQIVVDEKGIIIVGHGRYAALQHLGWEIKPEYILQVNNLTQAEVNAYRLADNKLNESDWDMDLVLEELHSLADAELQRITGFDMDLLLTAEPEDDTVPETPEEPKSKLGDLYQLGNHRVLCGDSTKLGDVEKVMDGKKADVVVTDPPYNTGMTEKSQSEPNKRLGKKDGSTWSSHMFNDSFTPEQWDSFLNDVFTNYFTVTKGDCAFYVFIDWRRVQDIRSVMESMMDVKNVIVWDKGVHGLGSDYKYTYELCIVGKKGKPDIQNRYGLDYQDIWRVQRTMGRNDSHATAKPIELLTKPLTHASKTDDIALDLFLGSGSTLIAAEKTGRHCYGLELDPKYVDVIVQRYVDYVDTPKVLLNGKEIVWNKTVK